MTLQKSTKELERAQAAFKKKELQQREGRIAMAEYEAATQAMRDKTARLKLLRQAREAEEANADAKKAATAKLSAAVGKAKKRK